MAGANVLDLVKLVANLEKAHGTQPLSPACRAIMVERVNLSIWYDIDLFHELLRLVDRLVVKGSESRALDLGATGGAALRGILKAYVVLGDAHNSVLAMRHAWRAHFNFGRLAFELPGGNAVLFRLEQFDDMPMVHALMTAGWGVAAARAAGARDASATVLARPWLREGDFTYRVEF